MTTIEDSINLINKISRDLSEGYMDYLALGGKSDLELERTLDVLGYTENILKKYQCLENAVQTVEKIGEMLVCPMNGGDAL